VERLRVKALLADPAASPEHEAVGAAGIPSRKAQSSLEGTPASPSSPSEAAGSVSGTPAAPGRDSEGSQKAGTLGAGPSESEEAAKSLPEIDSCVELFPTADFQEREAFDFFGIVFRGHPDLRRMFMPEDYVGWPQRRDFPMGGEPVLFTKDEPGSPGWWRK
jgi:hypothetical protein